MKNFYVTSIENKESKERKYFSDRTYHNVYLTSDIMSAKRFTSHDSAKGFANLVSERGYVDHDRNDIVISEVNINLVKEEKLSERQASNLIKTIYLISIRKLLGNKEEEVFVNTNNGISFTTYRNSTSFDSYSSAYVVLDFVRMILSTTLKGSEYDLNTLRVVEINHEITGG